MNAREAFQSRTASVTTRYQNGLLLRGELGQIAFGLFRAQKRSTVAKGYRRRAHKQKSYDGKHEAMRYLDAVLNLSAALNGIVWGWKEDRAQEFHNQVLYVDLPLHGQVSFHSDRALSSHRYGGSWDSSRASKDVVIEFCDSAWESEPQGDGLSGGDLMPFGYTVATPLSMMGDDQMKKLGDWSGILNWTCLHAEIARRAAKQPVVQEGRDYRPVYLPE